MSYLIEKFKVLPNALDPALACYSQVPLARFAAGNALAALGH